jgi:hypothetical protein
MAFLGILLVTAFVAVSSVLTMSRLDADPRSHPHRTRHLVRH